LFLADRLHFHYPDGTRCPANSGAPAALCSFGAANAKQLRTCGIAGFFVEHWQHVGPNPVCRPARAEIRPHC
jgi:hypothetical protein